MSDIRCINKQTWRAEYFQRQVEQWVALLAACGGDEAKASCAKNAAPMLDTEGVTRRVLAGWEPWVD